MLCKECLNKPVAKGIKTIKCRHCGEKDTVICNHESDLCGECSDKLNICSYCGKIQETGQIYNEVNGIEIIKPGILPETTIEFTCHNCGCVFKAKKGFYNKEYDQREGDFYFINCPTCGERVTKDC